MIIISVPVSVVSNDPSPSSYLFTVYYDLSAEVAQNRRYYSAAAVLVILRIEGAT